MKFYFILQNLLTNNYTVYEAKYITSNRQTTVKPVLSLAVVCFDCPSNMFILSVTSSSQVLNLSSRKRRPHMFLSAEFQHSLHRVLLYTYQD